MEILIAFFTAAAAFAGAWFAPSRTDKARARAEEREHRRKTLADVRELISWYSGNHAGTNFTNDAKYTAIRSHLDPKVVTRIESAFLPGAPRSESHGVGEYGSPMLDVLKQAVDELERKWF